MFKITHVLAAFAFAAVVSAGCTPPQVASDRNATEQAAESTVEVVLASDVEWEPLNPARGDKSPKAGTLWGDRNGPGPTGFLVQFVDGFSSPPHIHNVSYRGVVISGLIHNDDPEARHMWMPAVSFWTQPKGEAHITAARGSTNVAYIEIEEGPYLVHPMEKAFDSGERPINVDASNVVWVDQPGVPASAGGPQLAFLWGDPRDNRWNGSLARLPAGFAGLMRSSGSELRAVVIQGRLEHRLPGGTEVETMGPGSYFGSEGESAHRLSCAAGGRCVIYVRTQGTYDVIPAPPDE